MNSSAIGGHLDLDVDVADEAITQERLSRAARRRAEREVIADDAPREGVDIIRPVEVAVLVGVRRADMSAHDVDASLDELARLVETAGGEVVDRVVQRRETPEPATYLGRGKLTELRELAEAHGADAVVFDDDLTPAQQRTLEETLGRKVLDRTIVILDIFAQHATSREGKAQVELAQLVYMLPRLRGWGSALSRQAGGRAAGGMGIGGRGPGETQLEVDRRRIMRRITKLRRDLAGFARVRRTKGGERARHGVPTIALVGYTNAGKSSLLNRLTGSNARVEDKLFATLDPTVRKFALDDGRQVVLTDTVGFVAKLPHGLVEAFTSTLEETASADLLVHVVDASHPDAAAQIVAVHEVLEEIGAGEVAELVVLNKSDRADASELDALARHVQVEVDEAPIVVSAASGQGMDALRAAITACLPERRVRVTGHIPYTRQELVALAHRRGTVIAQSHDDTGTRFVADVDEEAALELRAFLDVDPFAEDPEAWEISAARGDGSSA